MERVKHVILNYANHVSFLQKECLKIGDEEYTASLKRLQSQETHKL